MAVFNFFEGSKALMFALKELYCISVSVSILAFG
jgi:hypothetical protein